MMGLSQVSGDLNKKGKNQIPSLPNGYELGMRKSFFGASSDLDIIAWLRGVALDPCNPHTTHNSAQKLHNQALNTWKILLMSNAECPRRKRKFELFLKGSNSTSSSKPLEEKFNNQSTKKASDTSCFSYSLSSYDGTASFFQSLGSGGMMIIGDNFQGKQMSVNLIGSDNAKNRSPSNSVSSGIYMAPQKAFELLITTGECPPRSAIPIGPSFQAILPKWTRTEGNGDLGILKWLGTQCWPREGTSTSTDRTTSVKAIGKGRHDSCSCLSPGSINCIRRHISEARRRLKANLGPVFMTWKLNEMGDTISSSWKTREQETFESLVKENPLNTEVDFWKCAAKRFPSKCKKSLVMYYYNVFILRRMSSETRSSSAREVVSDDDMSEESDDNDEAKVEHEKVHDFLKPVKDSVIFVVHRFIFFQVVGKFQEKGQ